MKVRITMTWQFLLYFFLFIVNVNLTPIKHMDNIVLSNIMPITYDSSASECAKKTGINLAYIDQLTKSDGPNGKLICFLACGMKKLGLMGADNNINIDLLQPYMRSVKKNQQKYFKILDGLITCEMKQRLELPDSNECLALHKFIACLHNLVLWTL